MQDSTCTDTRSSSAGRALEPPADWRPPTISFVASALPPLPAILEPEVASRARTHKTGLHGLAHDNRRLELASYETLEWKGDAALHWLVSARIQELFPTAICAELSDLRSRLTSNRTFAHLSWHYELPETIVKRRDPNESTSADLQQRLAANLFEAYLGAVIESCRGDLRSVSEYLRRLLSPAVFPAFTQIKATLEAPLESGDRILTKKRLRLDTGDAVKDAENRTGAGRRAVTKARLHEWTDEFVNGEWKATLDIQGRLVGTGTGTKIATARDVALDEYIEGTGS